MSPLEIVVATVVVAVGACVQGSMGYGLGLLVTPMLALIDPSLVPVPVLVVGLPMTILMVRREQQALDVRGVSWALAGRVPGTMVGSVAVASLSARSLTLLVAVLILASVTLSICRWKPTPTRAMLTTAGVVSGFTGTTTSIGGPPIALIYQRRGGPELRATLAAYLAFATLLSLAGLAAVGEVRLHELTIGAMMLPGMLIGYRCSRHLASILDQGYTRRAVLVLATLSALALGARELL